MVYEVTNAHYLVWMVDLVETEGEREYGEDPDHGHIGFLSLEEPLGRTPISLQTGYIRVGTVHTAHSPTCHAPD